MKDEFGIDILRSKFSGSGESKHKNYKLLKGKGNFRLFEVFCGDPEFFDWDEVTFEVIKVKFCKSFITGQYFEDYPTDKMLGKSLWRFDNGYEAEQFYNTKISW